MTRNLYLGADIFKVVEAAQSPDPYAIPRAVAEVFQTAMYKTGIAQIKRCHGQTIFQGQTLYGYFRKQVIIHAYPPLSVLTFKEYKI